MGHRTLGFLANWMASRALLFGWVLTTSVLASRAEAVPLQQWTDRAMDLVAKFEGSNYGAITLDADCQGLSLGMKQHTVRGNSLKSVFDEVIARVGRAGLDKIVTEKLGDKAAEFTLLVDESISSNDGRMARVRSWQEVQQGGRWVELTDTECKNGSRRIVAARDLRLKSPLAERISAFLEHPTVVQAQRQLISRSGQVALERATCWARSARGSSQPTFQEYLFFFDYLIQNGDSFTERNALQSVVLTMQFGKDGTAAKEDASVRQKMVQLKEWLEADFKNMRNAGKGRDHADFAKQNASRWMARFDEGAISKDQVKLAYVGLMRAMLGNNQWAYAAMNRRGTIVFGTGVVNGRDYDAQQLREVNDGADTLNAAALGSIQCRRADVR